MRCGCPECGLYMVQREQGLSSACICQSCGFQCSACMGTAQTPLTQDLLREKLSLLAEARERADTMEDTDDTW